MILVVALAACFTEFLLELLQGCIDRNIMKLGFTHTINEMRHKLLNLTNLLCGYGIEIHDALPFMICTLFANGAKHLREVDGLIQILTCYDTLFIITVITVTQKRGFAHLTSTQL